MSWVTPVVEVALGSTPLATSPSWTNITAYVIGEISTKQGRVAEFDANDVGVMTLTLNNRDRRFDPMNTAGPYYGNLKQRVRIRLTASGTTLFTGWIRGWPQTLDHRNGMATVTLEAVDALGMLALAPLPPSPHAAIIVSHSPDAYYPLNDDNVRFPLDASGNDWHLSSEAGDPARIDVELPTGQGSGMAGDSSDRNVRMRIPAVFGTAKRYQAISVMLHLVPRYNGRAVSGFVQGNSIVSFNTSPGAACRALIGVDHYAGKVSTWFNTGGYKESTELVTVADSRWHHVYVVVDRTLGKVRHYIDGNFQEQSITVGNGLFNAPSTISELFVGSIASDGSFAGFDGRISNLAMWNTDNANVWDIVPITLAPSVNGWAGQTQAQRVTSILDAAGWPTALRTGSYVGGPQRAASSLAGSALDALQALTRVDGSAVLAERDGKIKVRDRNELLIASVSVNIQASFVDSNPGGYRYSDAQVALDDQYVINSVRASRSDSDRVYVVTDKTSVASYYYKPLEILDLNAYDDLEVVAFAKWLLSKYAQPQSRLASLVINARINDATLGMARQLWIGHRVTIALTPLNVGSGQTYTQWIESVEHHINMSDLTWFVTYTTSPARSESLFILDSSLLDGAHTIAQ